ncbi:sensor histidine kinase [Paracrocinitomix mangrovi]|uniref:sensor histidine kinase n=1 Tax=Paracrocinitomix mangrovi TaxID=2862509 RepID=UPI001C8D4FAD|nr:sensor histidine kinase [Paracrocinitomix mangrovi]UKN01421.1 sensor histidine kinase [Paracrocinitomix mangrovi]
MNLIKLPNTAYQNYFDQTKFNLTWRINLFIFGTNLILIPIMYFLSIDEMIGLLVSSCFALTYQIILYKTRKYKIIAIVWVVNGVLSIAASILLVPTVMHLTDLIFMFMSITYAFFILGNLAGILVSAGNLISLTTYLVFQFNEDLKNFQSIDSIMIVKAVAISIYGLAITAYIFYTFLKLNKYATDKYIEANKALEVQNEIVEKQNAEKSVMLREIHHRVKNNLQVITSLLRLQSYEEDEDGKSMATFNEAIRRVSAMSLIHEKIYQSEDLAQLDFQDYIQSLMKELIESYDISKEVELNIQSHPFNLSNRYFVPIALLCNELISNSLKHAFAERMQGRIEVEITYDGEKQINMSYSDNGNWKPGESKSTFGMELIDALVDQLNGTFERKTDEGGTHYHFIMRDLNKN